MTNELMSLKEIDDYRSELLRHNAAPSNFYLRLAETARAAHQWKEAYGKLVSISILKSRLELVEENARLRNEVEIGKSMLGNAMGVIADLQEKIFAEEKDDFRELIEYERGRPGAYQEAWATIEKNQSAFSEILERLKKVEQENEFLRRNEKPVAWQVRHAKNEHAKNGPWINMTESEFKTARGQEGYEFRELFATPQCKVNGD